MKFPGNNEFGFDTHNLGFPSIHTCHAIVYQTAGGISGYHSMGGQTRTSWEKRAIHFAKFVKDHEGGVIPPGSRLYGCAVVCPCGRYAGTGSELVRLWKEELVDFASKLTYTGKISGYRLNKSVPFTQRGHSFAYVEYVINGDKCVVSLRAWGDNEHLPARISKEKLR